MKRPLANVLALLTGDAATRGLGFLITVYLARVLTPEAFGIINIGLAVLGHLTLIGSPGIQVVETRNAAIAEGGIPDRVGGILWVRLLLAMVLMCATWLIVRFWFGTSETSVVILLYAASLIPMAVMLDWFFQGKEDFATVSVSRVLNAIVYGVGVGIIVTGRRAVVMTPVAFLLGGWGAAMFLLARYVRLHGMPSLRPDIPLWKNIARQNLPVGGAVFLAQMVINLPPLVIGYFLATREVGIYSAALKLAFLVLFVDRVLNALFLPVMSRYIASRQEEVPFLLSIVLKAALLVLFPLLMIVIVGADIWVALVFGPGYETAAPLLRLLTVFILLTVVNTVFVCTVVGAGRERVYSRIMSWGALALATMLFGLIPLVGPAGAAIAMIASECMVTSWMMRETARVTSLPSFSILYRPLASAAGMCCTVLLLRDAGVFVQMAASLVVFAAIAVVVGGMTGEEIRFLRERFV